MSPPCPPPSKRPRKAPRVLIHRIKAMWGKKKKEKQNKEEVIHLQARKRGLTRHPAGTLILDFQPRDCENISGIFLSHSVCHILLWKLQKTNTEIVLNFHNNSLYFSYTTFQKLLHIFKNYLKKLQLYVYVFSPLG